MSREAYDKVKKPRLIDRIIGSRLVKSMVVGFFLAAASFVIVGFNLSANSGVKMDDNLGRYFRTCVREAFIDSTPRVETAERGFPLSYWQKSTIPVCEDGNIKTEVFSSNIDFGAFLSNTLFWAVVTLWVLRSFIKKKRIATNTAA